MHSGPTGGYCIEINSNKTKGNAYGNSNALLDESLCDLIAQVVGPKDTLVDLGAGVGHYGACLQNKRQAFNV